MVIQSIELENFRNYQHLRLEFDRGINIFHGSNAQGKTNLLEAVYVGGTSKSHKSVKDKELIRFGAEEAHIKLCLEKKNVNWRIDMHLRKNRSKGIALNGVPIRRASELFGIAALVFFSPEDLGIIKNGPAERRRFLDVELCQLNRLYTHELISYNRIMNQKNRLLKESAFQETRTDMLDIYNEQLIRYGSEVIRMREAFIQKLSGFVSELHAGITENSEKLEMRYEKNTEPEEFSKALQKARAQELKQRVCLVGPHRDDIAFSINSIDIRHFGSQGQQRTAALSLKLAEIKLVEAVTGDQPVLLLDDVLSELDRSRQTLLLRSIGGIQTLMTCTGLDDFISNRFHIDKLFSVKEGIVTGEN